MTDYIPFFGTYEVFGNTLSKHVDMLDDLGLF